MSTHPLVYSLIQATLHGLARFALGLEIRSQSGPSTGLPSCHYKLWQAKKKKCYFFAIKSGYNLSIGDENEEENDGKDQLKHTHTHLQI